ncbi:unnamed protein product [Cuscuta campestris]|uniref:Fungal lipase-type domain-containing protein n=1 Tax=Cuscuta campestris TaxID=132261 RepID=A0A484NGS0_9ASTE|nr:unnamed protein product [Cuscuta campestris]
MMEGLHRRIDTWIKDHSARITSITRSQLRWPTAVKWPWCDGKEHRKRIQEEYERRKKQLKDLCFAVKAESVSDLQDILCCMVLSECVYKRNASDIVRAVNKFMADFGGNVSIERVQPSSDHVPHRYLLAEAGNTLFASFIGTKQYKDVMADVNIFQGAIFHEDPTENFNGNESTQVETEKNNVENFSKSMDLMPKPTKSMPKPAVHKGFMARAKGIPALELYRLAQKKKRKLVLCGHSLGGAVAVLATLAILRVVAASSKEHEKIQVKCVTFSQPPVGNAALKDYVNSKGWQSYFKTYCIPEDLVPRILSPAYFHHYNAQPLPTPSDVSGLTSISKPRGMDTKKNEKGKEKDGEQLVLGVGPVQNPFWRLSRLVPLEGVRSQLYKYSGKKDEPLETSGSGGSALPSSLNDISAPRSLEIQEGSDGITLRPLPQAVEDTSSELKNGKFSASNGEKRSRRIMPSLPSYVPFGQLFLLGSSSIEFLSGAEYSKLISVKSVLTEVRERFQSHSMRSYRARFQRIYELCTSDETLTFLGVEKTTKQFPQLQKWLGISVEGGAVELGHIVEPPVIRAATSIVPLGWSGVPGDKNSDSLRVDISGFGLHLCTLVQARINGRWCSTTVESFPSQPEYSSGHGPLPELQHMRVSIGAPLRRPPNHQMGDDMLRPMFPPINSARIDLKSMQSAASPSEGNLLHPDGLDLVIFCRTDFGTVSKEVDIRTRRVRLIGLEGAGKTSLLKAILNQGRSMPSGCAENLHMDADVQEGLIGGLCYSDSSGVNLQNLKMEASCFRDELWKGIRDLGKKTDLIVLVHNLSHRIPRYSEPTSSFQPKPALSLLLEEAKSLGIPWVLAITNKFSVSAHQQKAAIDSVLHAYQAFPSTTEVINSCPYVMPTASGDLLPWKTAEGDPIETMSPHKLIFAPLRFVTRPFQKKASVFPVEGVSNLCCIVHRVLRSYEEAAFQELAKDRLFMELVREHAVAADATREAMAKENAISAAAVGASLGAGIGIVFAVVMGAASAWRKP